MYQQYMNQAQAKLTSLSSDDLNILLYDDSKLEDRVNEVLSSLEAEKDVILNASRNIAEENLAKEPILIEKRGSINDLSTQGKELCQSVQETLATLKSKSSNMNQDTALALLQTAAAESEEYSETIVKQLMDKELLVDAFLDTFLQSRKTMHLRKLKAEKMVELVKRNRQGSGITQPYTGFYPPSVAPYPTGGQTPYPMGPIMGMPSPGNISQY